MRFFVGFAESDVGGGRALGVLRVVVPRWELEKDEILKWVAELAQERV